MWKYIWLEKKDLKLFYVSKKARGKYKKCWFVDTRCKWEV